MEKKSLGVLQHAIILSILSCGCGSGAILKNGVVGECSDVPIRAAVREHNATWTTKRDLTPRKIVFLVKVKGRGLIRDN